MSWGFYSSHRIYYQTAGEDAPPVQTAASKGWCGLRLVLQYVWLAQCSVVGHMFSTLHGWCQA